VFESNNGISIPLLTLESILKKNNLTCNEALLKMDCEGCEYEVILSASRHILRKFSYIQIEYHYGYENLKAKLEECNFSVSVTRPVYDPAIGNPYKKPRGAQFKNVFIGYIYAKREQDLLSF